MDILSSFPTKYLQKSDFAQPKLVTVDTVVMEDVSLDNQPAEMKPVLYFAVAPKGMILNKTNANICAALWGPETTVWAGKQIVAYDDVTIQYQGKLVGGIRLRPADTAPPVVQAHANTNGIQPADNPGQPANAPFNDDIPNW